jgi:hypothetical protein
MSERDSRNAAVDRTSERGPSAPARRAESGKA